MKLISNVREMKQTNIEQFRVQFVYFKEEKDSFVCLDEKNFLTSRTTTYMIPF